MVSKLELGCTFLFLLGAGITAWTGLKEDIAVLKQNDIHYQKDSELFTNAEPFLYENLDPKAGWALRNLDLFPLEVTRASYDMLLRVPGIGFKSAKRIVRTRNVAPISESSLGKMGVVMKRARYFLSLYGKYLGRSPILGKPKQLQAALADESRQLPAPGQLWQPELFKTTNDE